MAVLVAAAALAAPDGSAGGTAFAQPAGEIVCPSAAAGEDCVYHVTDALAIRDIKPNVVRVDPDTGYVYVATVPHAGSRDFNYSYLNAYNSSANGYLPIAEFRFDVGINTRIADFEINTRTNELHVVHLWGLGDPSEGWTGQSHDGQGRANLTTIDLDTHEISKTIRLYYNETAPLPSWSLWSTDRFLIHDIALDRERDLAYIGAERAPILVVDTSTTTLVPATVNRTGTNSGADGWNAYAVGTISMSMSVDEDTGIVYAGVVVGNKLDDLRASWGIAALNFTDANGSATAHYTRVGFHNVSSQQAPSDLWPCSNYYSYSCDVWDLSGEGARDARIEAMHLDGPNDKLFALYENHTVWALPIGADGLPSGAMAAVHIRTPEEEGRRGDASIHDIALDSQRGLLYASLRDYTDPRVIVMDSDTEARVGVASTTSEPWDMGINPADGSVYVLPLWALGAYVIEAEPRTALQKAIDAAAPGATVVVEPGTYANAVLDINKSLTLTVAAGEPGAAKFTGYSRIEVEADDVAVRGLVFEDTDCLPGFGGSLVEIRTHDGITRENVTIEGNVFRDTCHAAIQKEGRGDVDGIRIMNNTFVNIGLRLDPGMAGPLDTGGESEFQIMHGAIGLAHHPNQDAVSGNITGNYISGTSAAGIRVFNAHDMVISDNYIADTPASAIGLAHNPQNVVVRNNTIVGANSEPDLDYIGGIEGSGDADYWKFLGAYSIILESDTLSQDHPLHGDGSPSPDAAINVWSDGENIRVEGNTIRDSDGAFTICTGVCAFESDGNVRGGDENGHAGWPPNTPDIRNIPFDRNITDARIAFVNNVVYAYNGTDNNGALIRSDTIGELDASGNTFVGCGAGMAGRPVPTFGNVTTGSAVYEDAGCEYEYHVTRTLGVGDVIPSIVRVDEDTGYVYVANTPHLGARDQDYSHLRIYDGGTGEMLGDIRFNGTNSRISDVEAAGGTVYVAHMWGIGDRSLGWDGRTWNGDGLMNLTAIEAGSHGVLGTIGLVHGDGAGGNATRDVISDLAVDAHRGRAYVSTERAGPVLAVDVSDPGSMRLMYTSAGNASAGEWSPYATAGPVSALAVDNGTGMVYAAARVGDRENGTLHSWGIATLDFGAGGAFAPNYTRAHFMNMSANPAPDPAEECGGDYNLHPCSEDVLVESLLLDESSSSLFALYANHSVWEFRLDGAGRPVNYTEVDVRQRDPAPGSYEDGYGRSRAHNQISDIALDRERRLLYASLHDFANPRVAVIDADTHERVGLASTSSQASALGLDARTGAVYALPQWTPNAYVIEAAAKTRLQSVVDGALPGEAVRLLRGTHDDTVLDIARPLTLASASDLPGSVTFTGYSRIEVEADNTAIRGLSFRDTDCMPGLAASLVEIRTYGNGYTRSNITVAGNTFGDTCHAAVQQEGVGRLDNVRVLGNTFERIGLKLADGRTQPIDTGGESEFQLMHGAIGLAHHPSQMPVSGVVADNRIVNTSAAGIRVFNADGMAITNNYVEGTPASGIGLAHGPSNTVVANNTLVRANSEPNLDYLDGIEGSGEPGYYGFINFDRPNPYAYLGLQKVRDGPPHAVPSPDAAISVWAGAVNVNVTGNTVRESDGAFTVCTGVCAFESDGPVRDNPRNVPANDVPVNEQVRFAGNTIHAHNGTDNSGMLVRSYALGTLDATGNTFVGIGAAGAAAGMVRADADREPLGTDVAAAFVSPGRILAIYGAPLGPPAGHAGPAYGSVTGPGGLDEAPVAESGLYTRVHAIEIGGDGVDAAQTGTIALNVGLEGTGRDGTPYAFAGDSIIPVRASSTNAAVASAAFTSPDTARIVYGAPLAASASDYSGLRIGPSNASAAVLGVSGSGTAAHTLSFKSDYSVTAATAGSIDVAPLALLPDGGLFAGADGLPIGSGSRAGTTAVAPPGSDPFVIEADTFADSLSGTGSAAIRVPGGAIPAVNFTVSTDAATVTFASRTNITDRGTGMPYEGAINVTVAAADRRAAAAGALGVAVDSGRIGIVVEIGDPNADIALDRPARILLAGQPAPADVYRMDSAGTVARIAECGDAPAGPAGWLADNRDSVPFCHTVEGGGEAGTGDYAIYTYRLSAFFVVGEDGDGGGGMGGGGMGGGPAPAVSRVEPASANGTYGQGETVAISVVFTETVNVTGMPTLQLETGAVDRSATYVSADSAALMFRYVVQPGDSASDLGYTGTDALALNGGTIRDADGNDANLALPAPGSPGSLSHSGDIAIEAPVEMVQKMTANLVVPDKPAPQEPQVVVAAPPAPPFMPFGGGGGGGRGGGGGGAGVVPGAAGSVVLYAAAWDCDEGTIRITAGSVPRADVSVVSSAGTVAAQESDGPHPAGRTVYEAPLPEDQILSIRAAAVDGRTMSTATEAVRTGGQCTGEIVFRAYDAAAAAAADAPREAADSMPQAGDPAEAEGPSEGDRQQRPPDGEDAPPAAERPDMPVDREQEPADAPPAPPSDAGEERPDARDAGEEPPTTATTTAGSETATAADDDDDDGGCLIATAAYGTEIAPQVQHLREVRDGTLLTTESGRAFMAAFGAAYYAFSPHVADLEREHPAFRQAVAALVAPMLLALQVVDAAEPGSEHGVAAYGALAIALVMGMYVAAPAAGMTYAIRLARGGGCRRKPLD